MRVSLLNLGCKVNQAELSGIEGSLRALGHDIVNLREGPDYCIVNTCTVTKRSDSESRQLIRRALKTGARVIVTGCFSELNMDDVGSLEGVEAVVANTDKSDIINRFFGGVPHISLPSSGRTRFFLKVQDGCDNCCSYCVVRVARGASRSEEPDKVIDAVKAAAQYGHKEAVLVGVHLGHYGAVLEPERSLPWLVRKILDETSIHRLRLSSIEVNEVDEELMRLYDEPRVCRHIHIPIQSGDDRVLGMMKRKYDVETVQRVIWDIHDRHPDLSIGTDIIGGFPCESSSEFENTLRLVEELPFTYLHVFPYSRRPGTEAVELKDNVGDEARRERAAALRRLGSVKKEAYLGAQVGRVLDVLVEGRIDGDIHRGTSSNYLKVHASLEGRLCGNIVPIRIEAVRDGALAGKLVKSP